MRAYSAERNGQSVRMCLKAREKLNHITEASPASDDPRFNRWDIEDTIVKGWICNSLDKNLYGKFLRYPTAKEVWDAIATTFYDGSDAAQVFDLNKKVNKVKQAGRSIEEYYNELQDLWLEIDFRRPNPMECTNDIGKFNKFIQESRVYSFLDGLDDKLDNERANVLQMVPFPTLEQAFARVRKEATRQEIMNKGNEGDSHAPAAMISRGQKFFDKSRLKCTHCGQTKHTKEQCFQLVGYPEWFKDRRKSKSNWPGKGQAAVAQAGGSQDATQPRGAPSNQMAGSQPNQWVVTENQEGISSRTQGEPSRGLHAAGTSISEFQNQEGSGNFNYSKEEEWVLDTGATDHMTYTTKDLINSISKRFTF